MCALILKILEGRNLYINGDFTKISNNEIFDRLNNKTKKLNVLLLNSVDYFECRVYERKNMFPAGDYIVPNLRYLS